MDKNNLTVEDILHMMKYDAISHNKHLKDVVDMFDVIILLRNVHFVYRSYYAHELYKRDYITKKEGLEFTTIL